MPSTRKIHRFIAQRLYAIAPLCVIGCSSFALAQAKASTPVVVERPTVREQGVSQTVQLTGEQATLPLVLVGGYPFLEGEVNGVKGKLQFDVGEKESFALNSHKVIPPDGKVVGNGYFGSGQKFSVFPASASIRTMRTAPARELH